MTGARRHRFVPDPLGPRLGARRRRFGQERGPCHDRWAPRARPAPCRRVQAWRDGATFRGEFQRRRCRRGIHCWTWACDRGAPQLSRVLLLDAASAATSPIRKPSLGAVRVRHVTADHDRWRTEPPGRGGRRAWLSRDGGRRRGRRGSTDLYHRMAEAEERHGQLWRDRLPPSPGVWSATHRYARELSPYPRSSIRRLRRGAQNHQPPRSARAARCTTTSPRHPGTSLPAERAFSALDFRGRA